MPVAIEVEVCAPRGGSLFFQPLQRKVRGRFAARDLLDDGAAKLAQKWPEPIPGQRIGLTADGSGYLVEPLHEAAHQKTRSRIEASNWSLPPEREEFPGVDLPTWQFWIKRAVEAGLARVVSGRLPEKIEGKPRKLFITQRQPDPRDGLIKRLVGVLYATLPESKRREVDTLLADADLDPGD